MAGGSGTVVGRLRPKQECETRSRRSVSSLLGSERGRIVSSGARAMQTSKPKRVTRLLSSEDAAKSFKTRCLATASSAWVETLADPERELFREYKGLRRHHCCPTRGFTTIRPNCPGQPQPHVLVLGCHRAPENVKPQQAAKCMPTATNQRANR